MLLGSRALGRPVHSYASSSDAGTCTCRATNSTAAAFAEAAADAALRMAGVARPPVL
ncbi:hypothetical protein [Streptomyces sp. NPDC001389]|uniref:hypothetical protein n=1 Tax=Streptomyces sp. NPDC001389 TaxID=3364569 RepID=UPI0036CC3154